MLTKSEKQIMDLLWSVDTPLSCMEIVEMSPEKTWKDSYIHSLIKSLMNKGVIQVGTFELVSRSYARKFSPKLNKAQFYLREYLTGDPDAGMPKLIGAYLDGCADPGEIKEIESMLRKWKKANPSG